MGLDQRRILFKISSFGLSPSHKSRVQPLTIGWQIFHRVKISSRCANRNSHTDCDFSYDKGASQASPSVWTVVKINKKNSSNGESSRQRLSSPLASNLTYMHGLEPSAPAWIRIHEDPQVSLSCKVSISTRATMHLTVRQPDTPRITDAN